MFVYKLDAQQRQAVFDLAMNLAAADNDISEEEVHYLEAFSAAFGIEYDTNKNDIDIGQTLSVFKSRSSKVILLQELIKLSYKDGHFGDEEQDKVFSIANKLGINDPELMLQIEKWVRDGFNHVYYEED